MPISRVLETHFEQLQTLWHMRRTAIFDPNYTLSDLENVETLLESNVDGLIIGGMDSVPILEPGLTGGEPTQVFAASYVMLRMEIQPLADRVVDVFEVAADEALDGFLEAFCYGPIGLAANRLRSLTVSAPVAIASIAMAALAFQGMLDSLPTRMRDFFVDNDPRVRRTAWRLAALVDPSSSRGRI